MEIRRDLYNYHKNKKALRTLQDKILFLETKATKITPSYSDDNSIHGGSQEDRMLENIAQILEVEKIIKLTTERVKRADDFLKALKPYPRHIITLTLVNHVPYDKVAKEEKTSVSNIYKIVDRALKK